MMQWDALRVVVTGGAGFVGDVVCRLLAGRGCQNLFVPRSCEYDLTAPAQVALMFREFRPEVVIHLAAVVGGIGANRREPGRFCYENLAMGLKRCQVPFSSFSSPRPTYGSSASGPTASMVVSVKGNSRSS